MVRPAPRALALSLLVCAAVGCVDNAAVAPGAGGATPPAVDQGPAAALNGIDTDADGDGDGIVALPASVPALFRDVFGRYTAVETPNGGRVHLVAQDGVETVRLVRVREVLRQHLADVPGSHLGGDKRAVADAMANHGATLAVFRHASTANPTRPEVAAFLAAMGSRSWGIIQQNVVVEGSSAYHSLSPAIDNTFGATAVLVHRTGFAAARPAHFQAARLLAEASIAAGTFVPSSSFAPEDRDDAWVGLLVDVHSGVWAHDPNGDGRAGTTASYGFASRALMAAGDPDALAWIEAFFAPEHTYPAQVLAAFAGSFDCLPRANAPYTNRAQYLRDVSLCGTNAATLRGGHGGERLGGNAGDNTLEGRGGDDLLVGGEGLDTAAFEGPLADYTVTFMGAGEVVVTDSVAGRDGTDRLQGFERLQFADQAITF